MKSRRRIASPKGTGLRHLHQCDYSRDLRLAKWGSEVSLHSSNPKTSMSDIAERGTDVRFTPESVAKLVDVTRLCLWFHPWLCCSLWRTITKRLCGACCDRWWRTIEEFSEPPQVLRHCGQKPIEFENALHVSKSHLDLLALPARLLEGFRTSCGASTGCPRGGRGD